MSLQKDQPFEIRFGEPQNEEHAHRLDPVKYREILQQYTDRFKKTISVVLLVLAVYQPQIFAQEDPAESIQCLVEAVVDDELKTVQIVCDDKDRTEVTLEFLTSNLQPIPYDEEQLNNPPRSDMTYLSGEQNPNFNCHSYTLQFLQEMYNFDLGADTSSWLERGIDTFVKSFGEEVTFGTVERFGTQTTLQEHLLQVGDVVLYYTHDGKLLHSGVVTVVDGTDVWTGNKLGVGAEMSGTIGGIAWLYEQDGAYDESSGIGGGTITVYRLKSESLPTFLDDAQ